eukprot:1855498-Amphidinium_carterae.1
MAGQRSALRIWSIAETKTLKQYKQEHCQCIEGRCPASHKRCTCPRAESVCSIAIKSRPLIPPRSIVQRRI